MMRKYIKLYYYRERLLFTLKLNHARFGSRKTGSDRRRRPDRLNQRRVENETHRNLSGNDDARHE